MNAQVLILTASPNPCGNSRTMAKEFADKAVEYGATVTWRHLSELPGEGCRSCEACRTVSEHCVVEDALGETMNQMRKADVIVIAAPVWFLELPASLRRLVERWHSLIAPDRSPTLPSGKRGVLLLSQGAPADRYADLPQRYAKIFSILGIREVGIVRHCDAHQWPVDERIEILDDVRDAAQAALCPDAPQA